jgi:myotubularin-related protein 3/4
MPHSYNMMKCRADIALCRHTGNGAVIARCSQPEVGWLGWRSSADENLLKAIANACAYDRGHCTTMDRIGASTSTARTTEGDADGNSGKVSGPLFQEVLTTPTCLNTFHAEYIVGNQAS